MISDTDITIVGAVLAIGGSWGIVKTKLYFYDRDLAKVEKRIEKMDQEIVSESDIKDRCAKFETELCSLETKFERCKEGREKCQHEVSEGIWKYIKGDDELPRFVPMATYNRDKGTVNERLKLIEDRNTQQHAQIMGILTDIQAKVGR